MTVAPGSPRWLKGTARVIRNSPRLTDTVTGTLGRIQGNRTLVDVAARVFGWSGAVPVVFLDAGALSGQADVERLPVIVVNAVGVGPDGVDDVVGALVALQRATRGFRPVLVLDTPAFGSPRANRIPMELVIPEDDWAFEGQWADYVARRFAMILARYRAWTIVTWTAGALSPFDERLLTGLATYRPWEERTL